MANQDKYAVVVSDYDGGQVGGRVLEGLESSGIRHCGIERTDDAIDALGLGPEASLMVIIVDPQDGAKSLELLTEVKGEWVEYADLPVIVVTDQHCSTMAEEFRQAGANEVFYDPFENEEFKKVVTMLMN